MIIDTEVIKLNEMLSITSNVISFDVNHNLVDNKSFLVIYSHNHSLEIFDLGKLTKVFETSLISELPIFLTSIQHAFEGEFETSISDCTTSILIKKEVFNYKIISHRSILV